MDVHIHDIYICMSPIYTTADKFIFDPLSQCILFNVRNAYITIEFHKLRYKATQCIKDSKLLYVS